jgi:hypothetical protein
VNEVFGGIASQGHVTLTLLEFGSKSRIASGGRPKGCANSGGGRKVVYANEVVCKFDGDADIVGCRIGDCALWAKAQSGVSFDAQTVNVKCFTHFIRGAKGGGKVGGVDGRIDGCGEKDEHFYRGVFGFAGLGQECFGQRSTGGYGAISELGSEDILHHLSDWSLGGGVGDGEAYC